ncbi:hypothetical protein ACHWQZ_G017982 [Mnemiopsis leidyi]
MCLGISKSLNMSLDVLLEAADVLEKQKVASILTSMHEYDKNFATHKSNHDGGDMYHRERESIHHAHYRSVETNAAGPSTPPISEENVNRSSSPINNNRRRRPQPKLTMTGNYHLLKRTRVSESNEASNISVSPESSDEKFNKSVPPSKELYTFEVENEHPGPRGSRGSSSHSGSETWVTRSIHNQMEKNRRAQLRVYMNNLRDVIPSGPNRRKLTTLTLLQNARAYIQSLKEHEDEYEHDKQKLWRRHLRLRDFLCQLNGSTVLTVPGIPITPGIRKFTVDSPQAMDTSTSPRPDQVYLEDEYVSREPQESNTRGGGTRDRVDRADTVSELSDESDSIGTFSNSDGGETVVSPDKDL